MNLSSSQTQPFVVSLPLTGPLPQAESLFQLLKSNVDHFQKTSISPRVYKNSQSIQDCISFFPGLNDHDWHSWWNRVSNFYKDEVSLVVNNVQCLDQSILEPVCNFLKQEIKQRGFPIGGVQLDLILSNQERSVFGLHKDEQDVYTWIIDGEKTIYLWPYEYFSQDKKVSDNSRRQVVGLDHIDPTEHFHSAICIEAKRGDLVYWPHAYWHFVKGKKQQRSLSLALGLLPYTHKPFEFFESEARREFLESDDVAIQSPIKTAQQLFSYCESSFERLSEKVKLEQLRWVSSFGFHQLPEFKPKVDFDVNQVFQKNAIFDIFTREFGGKLAVISRGQILYFENINEIQEIIDQINLGKSFSLLDFSQFTSQKVLFRLLFSLFQYGIIEQISA